MMSNKQKERVAAKAFYRHMRKHGRYSRGDKLYTHTSVLVGTFTESWRFWGGDGCRDVELEPKWRLAND